MTYENLPITRKRIKADARKLLSRHGLLFKLIFGGFMYIAVTILFDLIWDYAFTAASYFFQDEESLIIGMAIGNMISVLPKFFLTAPLFMGLWHLAIALTNGGDPDFTDIFGYYTKGNFSRAYKAIAPLQLPLAFISSLSTLPTVFLPEGDKFIVAFKLIIFVLWFLVSLFTLGRLLPFINAVVCGGDQPVSLCLKASLAATKGKTWQMIGFILSFTPWLLLSLVTVGTLFIIFTFPYMMVAISLYASYLLTGEYKTQNLEETL